MKINFESARIIVYVFAVMMLIADVSAAQVDWENELTPFIESGMDEWSIPGLSIAVVESNETAFLKGYGVTGIDSGEPVDPQTIFAIGSTTKAFTATAVQMLAERGNVDLDTPIVNYLPGFQLANTYVSSRVTLRDVLVHRSGIANRNLYWFTGQLDRTQIIENASYLEQAHPFRSQYAYNNIEYVIAGSVIQPVTGLDWDRFMLEHIFTPLNMNCSSTNMKNMEGNENVAIPHIYKAGSVRPIPPRDIGNVGPAGSIHSTAADMAAWLKFNLNHGTYRNKVLLDNDHVSEMHTPQITVPVESAGLFFPRAKFLAHGLGWFIHDYHGTTVVEHSGNIDGMSAHVALFPEFRTGVAILTNLNANFFPFAVKNKILDLLLGREEDPGWSTTFKQSLESFKAVMQSVSVYDSSSIKQSLPPSIPMSDFTGCYTSKLAGDIEISAVGEKLRIVFGNSPGVLSHFNHHTFRINWKDPMIKESFGEFFLTFNVDYRGTVDALDIKGLSEDYTFTKRCQNK